EDDSPDYSRVTFGKGKGSAPVALHNVADGKIAKGSHDAVNGSQLFETNQNVAAYFGGGAGYKDGQWSAPTFTVKKFDSDDSVTDATYNNVASAFEGVGNSFEKVKDTFKNIKDEITKEIKKEITLAQGDASLWDKTKGAFVATHGENKNSRTIMSLQNGDISESSTNAIGSQLHSLGSEVATYLGGGAGYNDGAWIAPSFKVLQFNADGSASSKKSYPDVASAFDSVSESMTSINERIKEVSDNIDTNSLNWNEDTGSYDARHKGAASKITNVLDGKIAEGSQEVVNGGQLWQTNEKLKDVENRVDTIDQQVQDITIAVTDGAVNYDKDGDGQKTNSITLKGGNESEPVLIDNLADGRIEKGSKEAVNGGQLHDYTDQQLKIVLDDAKKYTDEQVSGLVHNGVNEAKSYTDMKFETLNYAIEDVRKEARQAAAIGLAVSNLRYFDDPGSLSVSFGSGVWRGQSAFALGAGYTSENGRIRSNLSATSAGGHWGVGGAITLKIK
ncbi:Vomp family autotransporter, partial [Candidatus Bartonella washoeensis]